MITEKPSTATRNLNGWGLLQTGARWHYFKNRVSLCGRFEGPPPRLYDEGPDDECCWSCVRAWWARYR